MTEVTDGIVVVCHVNEVNVVRRIRGRDEDSITFVDDFEDEKGTFFDESLASQFKAGDHVEVTFRLIRRGKE